MWISIDELIAMIGEDRAQALSAAMGGKRIYVPAKPGKTHRLAAVIGFDGMALLCVECGGMSLAIPKSIRKLVKGKIIELLHQGKSREEIARECGVSSRYVWYLASLGVPSSYQSVSERGGGLVFSNSKESCQC